MSLQTTCPELDAPDTGRFAALLREFVRLADEIRSLEGLQREDWERITERSRVVDALATRRYEVARELRRFGWEPPRADECEEAGFVEVEA